MILNIYFNLKNRYETTMLRQKKKDKFRYFELKIDSNRDFDKGNVYNLNVFYNVTDDYFELL